MDRGRISLVLCCVAKVHYRSLISAVCRSDLNQARYAHIIGCCPVRAVIRTCDDFETLSNTPSNAIVPDFASFSIEFWCLPDYTGNTSHPNTFVQQIMKNLKGITGKSPAIRVGGTSADTSYFDEDMEEAMVLPPGLGYFQPENITYGPKYFDYFKTFADDAELTFGLNLADNSSTHIQNAKAEGDAALSAIGERLAAVEIGNEPDLYIPTLRPADYDQSTYVAEWLAVSRNFNTSSFPHLPLQFGDVARPPTDPNAFQLETLLDFGINTDPRAKIFSQHHYFFDDGAPPLLSTLMNHTHTMAHLRPFLITATDAQAQGIKYIIGETSSASGGGKAGISDVFGAGLWVLDYLLYAASHGVKKMYFHQHTNHTADSVYAYPYTAFQPVGIDGDGPAVRPMYYGILAFDTAIGSGKSVVDLSDDVHTPAYALYDTHGKLDTVVIVNMNLHNATASTRASRSFDIHLPVGIDSVTARFLTAPGADSQFNITFDGYVVQNTTGKLVAVGAQAKKQYTSGGMYQLTLQDSEAAVVSLAD